MGKIKRICSRFVNTHSKNETKKATPENWAKYVWQTILFLLGFKVQPVLAMHKNGLILSPTFQNELNQKKDAWFLT